MPAVPLTKVRHQVSEGGTWVPYKLVNLLDMDRSDLHLLETLATSTMFGHKKDADLSGCGVFVSKGKLSVRSMVPTAADEVDASKFKMELYGARHSR